MKKAMLWSAVAGVGVVFMLAAGGVFAQDMPVPPDFQFKQTGTMGPAKFSHKFHMSKKLQCTDCHVKIFQMKKDGTTGGKPMLMADMMAGKYCGTCHNGTKAFASTDCMKCHLPPKQ